MAVLSVDLACRRWSDLGIVVLDRKPIFAATASVIQCEIIPFKATGLDPALDESPIDAEVLAGRLNHLCGVRGIRILMLDGPQAWKSASNGLEHARASERRLNTAAKTGLPGMVKPVTYRPFAEFCIDVYDALCRRGWRRLTTHEHAGPSHRDLQEERASEGRVQKPVQEPVQERVLVESYPHAAWKSLGLKPLPSKRRARVSDLAEAYAALGAIIPFTTNRPPNHDQLQAIVGGLAGLAFEERDTAAMRLVGNPPRREQGHWREGFIALPVAPRQRVGVRWLN